MSVEMMSLEAISQRVDSGQSLLIDVRTAGEFHRLHARGAHSMPLDRLDPHEVSSRRGSDGEPIYVICQSGARSAKACEKLSAAGLSPVQSLEGGTAAWQAAGLPVERSAGRTISLERQVRIAAGMLVVLGTLLALMVHPAFLGIPIFVGSGLVFAGITDYCGMGLLLARMPWNK